MTQAEFMEWVEQTRPKDTDRDFTAAEVGHQHGYVAGANAAYKKLTETKALEIEPYIYSNLRGLSWFHYLHIQGGTGRKDGLGGQYTFYLTYLRPDQKEDIDAEALDYWCKERAIACGVGDTIEEAYSDFKSQLEKIPLK